MSLIKLHCPNKKCKKTAKELSSSVQGKYRIVKLECGHSLVTVVEEAKDDRIVFLDECEPYKYQYEGITIAENAIKESGGVIFADEMRLGKTIQLLGLLKRHQSSMLPAIGIVKASILMQWLKESVRVLNAFGEDPKHFAQILDNKYHQILPGFSVYLFSYDSLGKFDLDSIKEKTKAKTIFFDECQMIKNASAKRTKACQELAASIPNRIGISGTYIKNNASEAFPIFNIVDPIKFPSYAGFINEWVDGYGTSQGNVYKGIKPYRLEDWKNVTSKFIIRRERKDVLPDLPPINRTFFHTQLGDMVKKMYAQALRKFQEAYDEMGGMPSNAADRANLLAYITKMRHITGLAKIEPCVEWVSEFIEETEEKLAIFVHHQDVGEILYRQLEDKGYKPLKYTASMDFEARSKCMDAFTKGDSRLLIASTLAAGEGVTFPPCAIVMLERQWNPANEEQAEARPVKLTGNVQVNATYFLATGTIDEYFANLVEEKRKVVKQTLRGDGEINWNEESLMVQLIDIMAKTDDRFKGW